LPVAVSSNRSELTTTKWLSTPALLVCRAGSMPLVDEAKSRCMLDTKIVPVAVLML